MEGGGEAGRSELGRLGAEWSGACQTLAIVYSLDPKDQVRHGERVRGMEDGSQGGVTAWRWGMEDGSQGGVTSWRWGNGGRITGRGDILEMREWRTDHRAG